MRTLLFLTLGVAPLCLGACSGGSDTDDPDIDSETELFHDDHSPAVISGTITCPLPAEGVDDRFLLIDMEADDPQGAFTLKPFGHTFTVLTKNGAAEVYSGKDVVCSRDQAGTCVGSVNSTSSGIDCVIIDRNNYMVTLVDDDGNESLPFTLEITAVEEPSE
ncbi:MAG: hypothetical protein ACI9MC_004168 [Kiritimatiellia bacterium]|jgi:hypothetical protein